MTKFRTACLIHPHSPKMADPPLLSDLAGARPIKSTSGVPIIRAYQETAPWAAGTNCVRDLWGMAADPDRLLVVRSCLYDHFKTTVDHALSVKWHRVRTRL